MRERCDARSTCICIVPLTWSKTTKHHRHMCTHPPSAPRAARFPAPPVEITISSLHVKGSKEHQAAEDMAANDGCELKNNSSRETNKRTIQNRIAAVSRTDHTYPPCLPPSSSSKSGSLPLLLALSGAGLWVAMEYRVGCTCR